MVCHANNGALVPRTKHAVCTSFNLLSILSVVTVLPVPFRYRLIIEVILAHFFSQGKSLTREEMQLRLPQDER